MESQRTNQVLPYESPQRVRTRRPLLYWGLLLAGWFVGSFVVAERYDFETMQRLGHHGDGEEAWFCFTRSLPLAVVAGVIVWFILRRPLIALILGALSPVAVSLWMEYVVKW